MGRSDDSKTALTSVTVHVEAEPLFLDRTQAHSSSVWASRLSSRAKLCRVFPDRSFDGLAIATFAVRRTWCSPLGSR
jgi:hypothetical protein